MNDVMPFVVERRDSVACVILNRPEVINAINDAMRQGLPSILRELDADPAIRVVILRGAGDRGFCAGADLTESFPEGSPEEIRSRAIRTTWFDVFDEMAKPIIAALHGFCLGGGFEIALACDLRIASIDAVFSFPETGLGLLPAGGGTQRLPRLIGLGGALDIMLTGDRMDAAEAHRCGIVSRLVADRADLAGQSFDLAKRIAAKPPQATRSAKEAAKLGLQLDLRGGLKLERELYAKLATSEDRLEALAAFREKRPPSFGER
jgi:enoyl-CoA hydratase/carnithine racemase